VVVLALPGVDAATPRAARAAAGSSEKGLEEIAVVARSRGGPGAAELETRAEVGGRTKVLAGPDPS
jgi:hypothetical protein